MVVYVAHVKLANIYSLVRSSHFTLLWPNGDAAAMLFWQKARAGMWFPFLPDPGKPNGTSDWSWTL